MNKRINADSYVNTQSTSLLSDIDMSTIRHSHLGFVYIFSYLAGSHFITKTNPKSHFQE